jgi:SAM-dependent methyltransferase
MGLVDLATLSSLLICPACGGPLAESEGSYQCTSTSCDLARRGSYPVIGQWPVFIDFERSMFRPDEMRTFEAAGFEAVPKRWSVDRLPVGLRSLWKPTNRVAARNIELLLARLPGDSPLVLVIGGGTMGNGIEALYADRRARVVAFDLYGSPLTQFIADAHHIPLVSESVDAVVIQAVLEHVLDPVQVVAEIERVLPVGGLVYAETPFLQQVHAGPYDFVRYTGSGHRYLFRAFEEIAAGPVAGPGTQLQWSIDHIVRGLLRSELAGKIARGLVFWLRYLDRLVPIAYAMDSASAYYFLGRRGEHDVTPREIADYYQGAQHVGRG